MRRISYVVGSIKGLVLGNVGDLNGEGVCCGIYRMVSGKFQEDIISLMQLGVG